MSDNSAFKAAFAKRIAAIQAKVNAVPGKVAFELLHSVVMKSPVDTGRFRANWRVGADNVNVAIDALPNVNPLALGNAFLRKFRAGQTIYITNSLPYARKLEYGWSKQAPQGMVRITILEAPDAIKRAIRALD
ncbi:MAG: HK97 gp10 family phage protein [Comamonadaceae bacterium]|nr:MAG: HK97 gp10 family phage protein [Comamonadaceae bacterium]